MASHNDEIDDPEAVVERDMKENALMTGGAVALMTLPAALVTPFHVVRTLFQLGYDPKDAFPGQKECEQLDTVRRGTRLSALGFGRDMVRLHGWGSLSVGMSVVAMETLLSYAIKLLTRKVIIRHIPKPDEDPEASGSGAVAYKLVTESLELCIAATATYPLKVLYTRMIAELVGGEAIRTASSYPIMGLVAIYKEEGLAGLFGGLEADIMGELAYVVSTLVIGRLIDRYIVPYFTVNDAQLHPNVDPEEYKKLTTYVGYHLTQEAAGPFFYPFRVIRTLNIVSRSGLQAGRPPFGPGVVGTRGCFDYLWTMPFHRGLLRGAPFLSAYLWG